MSETSGVDNEQRLDRLLKHPRVQKLFLRETKLVRSKHIPYLAGYSTDGKTIYIDSSMPRSFQYKGRTIETDRFLIVHEELEKALIDAFGWEYLPAHRIAIVAERRAVTASGIGWDSYDAFMQENVQRIRKQPVENVPGDLDLTPYKVEPALLEKICALRTGRPTKADSAAVKAKVSGDEPALTYKSTETVKPRTVQEARKPEKHGVPANQS